MRQPSFGEVLANAISHGVGALLALAGAVVAIVFAALGGDPFHVTAVSIYGATLFLVFLSSTLYHSIPAERARGVLQLFDHSAIYLLIAGTYTPIALVTLRGPWGWSLFGVMWGLAVTGITLRAVLGYRSWYTAIYAAMGWGGVVVANQVVHALPWAGSALLLAGGLAYTAGIVFFVWERLPYHHLVWHLFVIAGAGLHFAAVLGYVAPVA